MSKKDKDYVNWTAVNADIMDTWTDRNNYEAQQETVEFADSSFFQREQNDINDIR